MMHHKRVFLQVGAALFAWLLGLGCASLERVPQHLASSWSDWRDLEQKSGWLQVHLPDHNVAEIGFETVQNRRSDAKAPWVVLVPGAGAPSRKGEQNGDGVRKYGAAVETHRAWARALAEAGFRVFSFDKRTCHPSQNPLCRANPTTDLDEEGPSALSRDVDAACAWLRTQQNPQARVVFMTHGQGLSPVLHSQCAESAKALVALAPIPRGIDRVMVHALEHRQKVHLEHAAQLREGAKKAQHAAAAAKLHNQAGSLQEMFVSMERGDFAANARIRGATLAYWRAWVRQTKQTQKDLKALKIPKLLLLGENDSQFGSEDQERIRRLAQLPSTDVREIPGADHHLLAQEQLTTAAAEAVIQWLRQTLAD